MEQNPPINPGALVPEVLPGHHGLMATPPLSGSEFSNSMPKEEDEDTPYSNPPRRIIRWICFCKDEAMWARTASINYTV